MKADKNFYIVDKAVLPEIFLKVMEVKKLLESHREKTVQEERPLLHIDDNFKKIIIVKGSFKPWYSEEGILILSIFDFLLDEKSLDL